MSKEPTQSSQSPTVPSATLEKLLNLTARSIQLHAKTGVIVKGGRGRYLLWDSVRGYVRYLQERSKLSSGSEEGEDSYEGQRKRLTRLRADEVQMRVNLRGGQLHDGEDVVYVMGAFVESSRAKLLSVPNACAATLADISDPEECRKILDETCRAAATALADYDPVMVIGKTREKLDEEDIDESEDPKNQPRA